MSLVLGLPLDVRSLLVQRYAGAVQNAVHRSGETCDICFTPVMRGWSLCQRCAEHRAVQGVADRYGTIIFAVDQQQSYHFMIGYKASTPVEEHQFVVQALIWQALTDHGECLARRAGSGASHWATVPSLRGRNGEHPLHWLVGAIATISEAPIQAAGVAEVGESRHVDGARFMADHLPPDSHVLLLEDTWVTGGHAQSAAIALRRAGAGRVSILSVARFLRPGWPATAEYLRRRPRIDFTPATCCWTGGACP